jgi:hypothetical protein
LRFFPLGGPVPGRPALDHVCNQHVFVGLDADRQHDFVKQLPGSPHKGFRLDIFILPGALSNDHDARGRISPIHDDIRATVTETALSAVRCGQGFFELLVSSLSQNIV